MSGPARLPREQEFVLLSHVSAGDTLHDFNMSIFRGEVVCLVGIHGSGKGMVKGVLEGRIPIREGSFLLDGQRLFRYDEQSARTQGIVCIDSHHRLVESISITENLFALRRVGNPFSLLYREQHAREEAQRLLGRVGLDFHPATKVYMLTPFEQQLVCIAKALHARARLMIIDCIASSLSYDEQVRLKRLVQTLSGEGFGVLIVDDKPTELLEVARKVVILKNGRDIKTLVQRDIVPYRQEELFHMVAEYLVGAAAGEPRPEPSRSGHGKALTLELPGQEPLALKQGEVLGFYDIFWDAQESFLQHLDKLADLNGAILRSEGQALRFQNPDLLPGRGVVYIPENSGELLMPSLSVADNLAAPSYRRMSSRLGVVNRRMLRRLDADFRERFGVDPALEDPGELSHLQRKLLTVYRWVHARAWMLLLENPFADMDVSSADRMRAYLAQLAESGVTCLVSSKSLHELSRVCDHIVCTQAGLFRAWYPRREFLRIAAEELI